MIGHNMIEEYGFEEVYWLHKKTIAGSRDECDPSVEFGGRRFAHGVIAANMSSVADRDTCKFLAENNLFYILNRFDKVDYCEFVTEMHSLGSFASISVGVNEESYNRLEYLKVKELSPEYITIDIANGYSVKSEAMTKFIKDHFPTTFLIVGNCATHEAVEEIESWGANAVKVGISNGHVCETYMATGCSRPQFSTVLECSRHAKVPIISDGAIRHIGDIVKAHVAGATMVMAGSLFAGYDESAGEIIEIEGKRFKQYFGSASYNNTRSKKNVEGKCILVQAQGGMKKLLYNIDDGLRSAISYAGGTDIKAFDSVSWGVRRDGVRR